MHKILKWAVILCGFFFFRIVSSCQSTQVQLYHNAQLAPKHVQAKQAQGRLGMVATAHPLASQTAIRVLDLGGNAVDAAVAASFMISVVRPQSTGLGGGGFMILHHARQGLNKVFDFRERAPQQATQNMYLDHAGQPKPFVWQGKTYKSSSVDGGLAVAVPGLVDGLLRVHEQHGKLPLAALMEDAIRVAREGFLVYSSLAKASARRAPILAAVDASRRLFYPQGRPLQVGERLVQRDLAVTLEMIRDQGRAGFYQGKVAQQLTQSVRKYGGVLTQQDLDSYHMKERQPLMGRFKGSTLVTMPPPSSGGVHILQMLGILSQFDLSADRPGAVETVHLTAEIMRHAYADRARYLGDPDFVYVPVQELLAPDYLQAIAAQISRARATPSHELVHPDIQIPQESRSTTHVSIVDREGNAVSTTQTINHSFGSGVVAQGTGVVLNNEMDDFSVKPGVPNGFGLVGSEANKVAARKTMLSSMSPTIVLDKKGAVDMVLGAPGGPRIITAVFQVIVNRLQFKMDLYRAVQSLRLHHQWLPDKLMFEQTLLSPQDQVALQNLGHTVVQDPWFVGDIQAIAREGGRWVSVSDMRSEGVALAQ
ncbi:MAG: gamma-glutamyltransferase [Zetaproteobacteria bacterium]|nr:gamma-glutamyltransferase [Zetaproteobacteria bacterium]